MIGRSARSSISAFSPSSPSRSPASSSGSKSQAAQAEERRNEFYEQRRAAYGAEEPKEQLAGLQDLHSSVEGNAGFEITALWDITQIARNAARTEKDPAEKLRYLEAGASAIKTLKSKYSSNIIAKLPWKPLGSLDEETAPSLVDARATWFDSQIQWLQEVKDGVSIDDEPDANLEGQIVLVDGEGNEKTLKLRFFSKEAPHGVDNFLRLARDGYYENTLLFGLEQQDISTTDNPWRRARLPIQQTRRRPGQDSRLGR